VEVIPQLKASLPGVPIIMLTVVDSPDQIVRALEAGACGYILKGGANDELVGSVEDALAGGATMSPAVARRLVQWFQQRQTAPKPEGFGLTEREWEVLRLAARGRQHGEISMTLGIAVNTVKNHFRNIYEKLGVGSLTEALIKLNAGRGLLDGR
jgi:DNA-binding NarL/FixJ family response regulator